MTSDEQEYLVSAVGGRQSLDNAVRAVRASTVFVYGSRARGDHGDGSDLEIGLVFDYDEPSGTAREFISRLQTLLSVRAYSFSRRRLAVGQPDVPFTRRIFVAELRHEAVTLRGEDLRQVIPVLPIRPSDLIEEHAFVRARILDGLVCARQGHLMTATELCWKASYMAGRLYLLATQGRLVSNRGLLYSESWPDELDELTPWMDRDTSLRLLTESPSNALRLLKVMTRPIYDVVDRCEAFVTIEAE